MAEMIAQLLATDAARIKLGALDISTAEAEERGQQPAEVVSELLRSAS
jgi:hypothetical protein